MGVLMNPAARRIAAALLLVALAAACSQQPADRTTTTTSGAAVPAGDNVPDVLATIGDEPVTMEDVRLVAGDELAKIEASYRKARTALVESALQRILRERVVMAEAQRQGKTLDQLALEEAGGSFEPNDLEITAWYEDNQGRVGGRSLDQVRPQIADLLRNQHREDALEKLETRLNAERGVKVMLEPYRLTFDNTGAPTKGSADAKVTVVEFSDFQCPFCQRFVPTLKQIEEQYGDRVQIVYRQYPTTSIHPNAFKAAEASLCAHEQGKFWEMHDLMFQEQDQLAVRDLKVKAGRLGLNQAEFDRCLDSGRHTEQVQNDLAEGARTGMTGTPAVFVNGVELPGGAVPFQTVARAIDRELAR
jgi:protein-disulfide isomerase